MFIRISCFKHVLRSSLNRRLLAGCISLLVRSLSLARLLMDGFISLSGREKALLARLLLLERTKSLLLLVNMIKDWIGNILVLLGSFRLMSRVLSQLWD